MKKDKLSDHLKPTCLGENIKFLRKLKGASQKKLGDLVGATRSQIASYESGAIEPRFKTLLALSDLFHVSLEELLSEDLTERSPQFSKAREHNLDAHDRQVLVEMKDLIRKTREMEKILEGYRTFHIMRSESSSDANRETVKTMKNLFDILGTQIKANWKLIRSLTDEEE